MSNTREKKLVYLLILLAMPLTGGGLDIYAPSLPYIVKFYNTSQFLGQMSITAYLIGFAMGSFLIGIVSDYCQYRPLIIATSLLFSISCFLTCICPRAELFVFSRFIQGLAVAGPSIIAKGYLGKLFSGNELSKKSVGVGLSWSIGLVLSPVIGGYLQHFFYWQVCFIFLGMYSLLITCFSFCLSYKNQVKSRQDFNSQCLDNVKVIITNRIFLGAAVSNIMIYAIITVYNTLAPFILQNHLHLSPSEYGHIGLFIGLSWMLGGLLNRYLVTRFTPLTVLRYGLLFYTMVAVGMYLGLQRVPFTTVGVVIPVAIIYFIGGMLISYGVSISLDQFPGSEGLVSALRTLLMLGVTALLSFSSSLVSTASQIPMLGMYSIMSIVALLAYGFFLRNETKSAGL